MRYSIVDIGSNTVRMVVYDIIETTVKKVFSEKESLGLVNYVNKGIMSQKGVNMLCGVLNNYKSITSTVNCDHFICFATASIRNILNTREVLEIIAQKCGIKVDVLSGEEEGLLDFYAAKYNFKVTEGLMIDMGGGSTEIVSFKNGMHKNVISEPFGSLYLYKKFVKSLAPTKKECKKIYEHVAQRLEYTPWIDEYGDTVYLIGGTARAIAKLHRDIYSTDTPENGYKLDCEDFEKMLERLQNFGKKDIDTIIRVIPERIYTILPGLLAFKAIFDKAKAKNIIISSMGIREGYIICKVLNNDCENIKFIL